MARAANKLRRGTVPPRSPALPRDRIRRGTDQHSPRAAPGKQNKIRLRRGAAQPSRPGPATSPDDAAMAAAEPGASGRLSAGASASASAPDGLVLSRGAAARLRRAYGRPDPAPAGCVPVPPRPPAPPSPGRPAGSRRAQRGGRAGASGGERGLYRGEIPVPRARTLPEATRTRGLPPFRPLPRGAGRRPADAGRGGAGRRCRWGGGRRSTRGRRGGGGWTPEWTRSAPPPPSCGSGSGTGRWRLGRRPGRAAWAPGCCGSTRRRGCRQRTTGCSSRRCAPPTWACPSSRRRSPPAGARGWCSGAGGSAGGSWRWTRRWRTLLSRGG